LKKLEAIVEEYSRIYLEPGKSTKEEALGIVISKHCKLDRTIIMKVFIGALEDADEIEKANIVREWIGESPKEYVDHHEDYKYRWRKNS
jgi:hypothetical protein